MIRKMENRLPPKKARRKKIRSSPMYGISQKGYLLPLICALIKKLASTSLLSLVKSTTISSLTGSLSGAPFAKLYPP